MRRRLLPEWVRRLRRCLQPRRAGTLAVAALVACGGAPERPDGGPAGAAPEPARHCFAAATETFTGQVRLTVAGEGRVTGEGASAIPDAGAGYYTSYHQALAGARDGDRLDLEVVTWIEEDRQVARETWTLEGGRLVDGRHAFDAADCGAVDAAIA